MLDFSDQFVSMRGLYHFCFMGSRSYSGTNFNLAISNTSENDIVQNMVENLLQSFLLKGFPYLSLLDGGYEKCHEFARHFKIDIERHDKSACLVCNPRSSKFKRKKRVKESDSFTYKSFGDVITKKSKGDKKLKEKELIDKNGKEMNESETFIFICNK